MQWCMAHCISYTVSAADILPLLRCVGVIIALPDVLKSLSALLSSTVKKMTELKSRGVKMLPSKDNHHKISVCKLQSLTVSCVFCE